ncbi:hypothetical protein [Leifsonia sp. TF02-11]|uniref:hypothetical protein n=1 Tax=Leifsonia sp. TF02-11 TaxID=2815212 RepID=UPI001AA1C95C|nr:hypothetical protein [Leifsonia sp. TF02-11]MBO1741926.1 hypothetical protein [Leifsonia sp. TF02-11]
MGIVLNVLALLAIICICLAGVAGVSYLAARRRDTAPGIEKTTAPRTDGRNTES